MERYSGSAYATKFNQLDTTINCLPSVRSHQATSIVWSFCSIFEPHHLIHQVFFMPCSTLLGIFLRDRQYSQFMQFFLSDIIKQWGKPRFTNFHRDENFTKIMFISLPKLSIELQYVRSVIFQNVQNFMFQHLFISSSNTYSF